jgi:DNA-binding transcriptional regulator GbsR (MarR family)
MPPPLTPLQQDLVAEFGNIYEGYGLNRLKGLILGLLMTQDAPVSLDDMKDLLGRSKGALSSAVRELAPIGLIRKVDGPINRRDYYVLDGDLFFNNFKFNMATVRKNRRTAEQFLKEMHAAGDEAHAQTIRKLEQMQAFYRLMESFYQDFAERWMEVRSDHAFVGMAG